MPYRVFSWLFLSEAGRAARALGALSERHATGVLSVLPGFRDFNGKRVIISEITARSLSKNFNNLSSLI